MNEDRVSGFVIANDGTRDQPRWKVRVKDEKSSLNGKKLIVASIHDDIVLAQGLNVTFLIGSIDGEEGSVIRAVDVQLQPVGNQVLRSKGDQDE